MLTSHPVDGKPCVMVKVGFLQLMLVFSALGTILYGYFFAFHLLNIVNTNQLLKSVLKAVTLNGMY